MGIEALGYDIGRMKRRRELEDETTRKVTMGNLEQLERKNPQLVKQIAGNVRKPAGSGAGAATGQGVRRGGGGGGRSGGSAGAYPGSPSAVGQDWGVSDAERAAGDSYDTAYFGPTGKSDSQIQEGMREALLEKLGKSDRTQQEVLRQDAKEYYKPVPSNTDKMREALTEMDLYGQMMGYDPSGNPSASAAKQAKSATTAAKTAGAAITAQGQIGREVIESNAPQISKWRREGKTEDQINQLLASQAQALSPMTGMELAEANPMPDDLRSVLAERMMREKGIPSASTGRVPGTEGTLIPGVGSGIRQITDPDSAADELQTVSFTNRQLNPGEILTASGAPKTTPTQGTNALDVQAQVDADIAAATAGQQDQGILQALKQKLFGK